MCLSTVPRGQCHNLCRLPADRIGQLYVLLSRRRALDDVSEYVGRYVNMSARNVTRVSSSSIRLAIRAILDRRDRLAIRAARLMLASARVYVRPDSGILSVAIPPFWTYVRQAYFRDVFMMVHGALMQADENSMMPYLACYISARAGTPVHKSTDCSKIR